MEYAPADFVLVVQSPLVQVTKKLPSVGHEEKVTEKGQGDADREKSRHEAHTVKNDAAQRSALQAARDCGTAPRTCLCLASTALAWHLELELVACGRKKIRA